MGIHGGSIAYALPRQSSVSLRIYSMHGKVEFSRSYACQQPGYYTIGLGTLSLAHAYHIIEFKADTYCVRRRVTTLR